MSSKPEKTVNEEDVWNSTHVKIEEVLNLLLKEKA
jgi:hypothetical protein